MGLAQEQTRHAAWNPLDPAGTMARAVDVPRVGHGRVITPAGIESWAYVHLAQFDGSKARGTAASTPRPPGTFRVRHPKGRTTARAGGVKERPDP